MDLRGGAPNASLELSKVDARGGRRHWSIARTPAGLTTRAWTDGKAARVTAAAVPPGRHPADEYFKAVRAKLRDGYVFARDRAEAGPGAIVFVAYAGQGGGQGTTMDLSPDGQRIVTGSCDGSTTTFWLDMIDVTTGQRRTVFERRDPSQQLFPRGTLFDRTGQALIVTLPDESFHLDLASGETKTLATYVRSYEVGFSSHFLRPSFDRDRRRLVLFEQEGAVQVVDDRFEPLLEIPVDHLTSECLAASLSPSGHLLAVRLADRRVRRAQFDTSGEIEVWDVDARERRVTLRVGHSFGPVGFDPTDERLLTVFGGVQGPVVYSLASHEEVLRCEDSHGIEQLAAAHGWVWSPDGTRFAVECGRPMLRTADMKTEVPLEQVHAISSRLVFSADGSLLASYEDNLYVLRTTA